jgi:hypothetical protein
MIKMMLIFKELKKSSQHEKIILSNFLSARLLGFICPDQPGQL